MQLSDDERRTIAAIEHMLAAEDPGLVHRHHSRSGHGGSLGILWMIFLAMAAFGVVLIGILTKFVLLGVVGFVLMIMAVSEHRKK